MPTLLSKVGRQKPSFHYGFSMHMSRRVWDLVEPIHASVYFVPERTDVYNALGLEPISHYFASRSAAMGPVPAEVVIATFYHFSPGLVKRAMRDAWATASPESVVTARYRVAGIALQKSLERLDQDWVESLLDIALPLSRAAASVLDPAGRPLFAGHLATPVPDDPLLELWHYLTLLREHRGDGHVAALQAHGFGPIPALVTADGYSKIRVGALQRVRGWRDDAWEAGVEEARSLGWIDEDSHRTAAGTYVREQMETTTNELSAKPWHHLGEERTEALITALEPIRDAVVASGSIPDY